MSVYNKQEEINLVTGLFKKFKALNLSVFIVL